MRHAGSPCSNIRRYDEACLDRMVWLFAVLAACLWRIVELGTVCKGAQCVRCRQFVCNCKCVRSGVCGPDGGIACVFDRRSVADWGAHRMFQEPLKGPAVLVCCKRVGLGKCGRFAGAPRSCGRVLRSSTFDGARDGASSRASALCGSGHV